MTYPDLYHTKSSKDKSINTLMGILIGAISDNHLETSEINMIEDWLESHSNFIRHSPFKELSLVLNTMKADGIFDEEERRDLIWFCKQIIEPSNEYYDYITTDIQAITGIAGGIMSDGVISDEEIKFLNDWLQEREDIAGHYPYDELSSILTNILKDGVISEDERAHLTRFFLEFTDMSHNKTISEDDIEELKAKIHIGGICATCPEIEFENKVFCFTGESAKVNRKGFQNMIEDLGCQFKSGISKNVDYLIVGNEGSPYWAYSCYGRKIEEAIQLRKAGHPIQIINELDFGDAL